MEGRIFFHLETNAEARDRQSLARSAVRGRGTGYARDKSEVRRRFFASLRMTLRRKAIFPPDL
ncbi:MAG: hypothetical protein D6778_06545 [Nitrospirae bacterium]|nr:MAG: hypothetical protein D6778_06545 [Nitrospirota bacterium]